MVTQTPRSHGSVSSVRFCPAGAQPDERTRVVLVPTLRRGDADCLDGPVIHAPSLGEALGGSTPTAVCALRSLCRGEDCDHRTVADPVAQRDADRHSHEISRVRGGPALTSDRAGHRQLRPLSTTTSVTTGGRGPCRPSPRPWPRTCGRRPQRKHHQRLRRLDGSTFVVRVSASDARPVSRQRRSQDHRRARWCSRAPATRCSW